MRRLGRDGATVAAVAFVVAALAAMAVAGALLADNQSEQRQELRDRFADRVDVATALIGSLLGTAYTGQIESASARYGGTVTRAQLDTAVRRGNSRWMAVVDESGTTIASSSGTPMAGERRSELARQALGARAGYALGDLLESDAIESAVAFPADSGRRVLVTAGPAMAFRDFLAGSIEPLPQGSTGRAYVFDRTGQLIAAVNAPAGLKPDPANVRDAFRRGSGETTSRQGEERFFVVGSIPATDWKIVTGVDRAELYETASGVSRWVPWIILLVGGLALVGVGLLVRRLLRTRARLHAANVSLSESRVRLQERADELERSNADLEQFAYAASHDLSEPLRTVAGFSQLLAARYDGKLDDEADEMIRYMGDGVDRMQQLIDDLLLYSRVGRAPLREDIIDLDEALSDACAWLGPAVLDAGASITSDPLPRVVGERGQLTQVFQNLVGNAVKFTAPGVTPEVRISATGGDGQWRIAVSDNGIGVDPSQRETVFKMFGRLHPADQYPGTGIGLALVKRIVERHGGRIWIESNPSGGSMFLFTLPDRVVPAGRPMTEEEAVA